MSEDDDEHSSRIWDLKNCINHFIKRPFLIFGFFVLLK